MADVTNEDILGLIRASTDQNIKSDIRNERSKTTLGSWAALGLLFSVLVSGFGGLAGFTQYQFNQIYVEKMAYRDEVHAKISAVNDNMKELEHAENKYLELKIKTSILELALSESKIFKDVESRISRLETEKKETTRVSNDDLRKIIEEMKKYLKE